MLWVDRFEITKNENSWKDKMNYRVYFSLSSVRQLFANLKIYFPTAGDIFMTDVDDDAMWLLSYSNELKFSLHG